MRDLIKIFDTIESNCQEGRDLLQNQDKLFLEYMTLCQIQKKVIDLSNKLRVQEQPKPTYVIYQVEGYTK